VRVPDTRILPLAPEVVMPNGSPMPRVPPADRVKVPALPLPRRFVPMNSVALLLTLKLTVPETVPPEVVLYAGAIEHDDRGRT